MTKLIESSENLKEEKLRKLRELKEERLLRRDGGVASFWLWVQNWTARAERLVFRDKPWLVPIYRDNSRKIVIKKPAQMGYTEWALAESCYYPDQYAFNSLYFMPTSGGLSDLVQGRLNPSIYNSPFLSARLGKLEGNKFAEKIGLKKMALGMWYGRGAQSTKQVKSVDADGIWVDERDELDDEIISYLDKRLQASKWKIERWFGTPTIPAWGIDLMYLEGRQLVWHISCPHCQTEQALSYQDNVDEDNKCIVCRSCRERITPHLCSGRYISENPDGEYNSYFASGLNSSSINLHQLIEDLHSGDENRIAQAYNQVLGVAYEPKGATITLEDLQACKGEYNVPFKSEERTFMGVDVGRVLNVWIMTKTYKTVFMGEVGWDEIDRLISEYKVHTAVFDALPETEKVAEYVRKYRGKVFACYYSNPKIDEGKYYKFDKSGGKVDVNRTASLDAMSALIYNQELILPSNIENQKNVVTHFKNIKRIVVEKDKGKEHKTGDKEAKWVRVGDDHYAHALNYAMLASKRLSMLKIY